MKVQRIITPEIVYTPYKGKNIKKEEKSHSLYSPKTKAMLTAAMIALATSAMADISVNANDLKNENETARQTEVSKKLFGAIGLILAVGGACALEAYSMDHDGGPDD